MFSEKYHNYPEGYEKTPWCPSTQLVQICASLAGVELTPETFCTETLEDARYSDGAIPWLKEGKFYPKPSCVKVNRMLLQQIDLAKTEINLPSDNEITLKIEYATDLKAKLKTLESYKKVKDMHDARESTINRWRNVIFETCCTTTSDEKNVHFRQFESADELTEEEITDKVTKFTEALNKITKYNPDPWFLDLGLGAAKNCPQSPMPRSIR